jgi:sigma-B regulation protein RsbU (phosphoserine phosphatase)
METELQTAHNAQMSIMPHQGPEIEGFDISGICVPAYEVGGDFFDYLWLNSKMAHMGIAVGDVSGKAMKAAMTAVMANGIIYAKSSETHSITEIMSQLNQSLYVKTGKKVFTALLIISIDTNTKKMTYTNAGLPEPLLKSGHSVTHLESSGSKIPLGIHKKKDFTEDSVQLGPGDVVVLFTDGISEARNSQQEFYGRENLKRFLENLDTFHLSSKKIVDKIMADIKRFSGGVDQFDDITVVVVKVL